MTVAETDDLKEEEVEYMREEETTTWMEAGFGNIIVVDNLPVVSQEKFEKLESVVRKIYGKHGFIKDDGFCMPVDQNTNKTLGYCFIEYKTPDEAQTAKAETNGYRLDRTHVFAVNLFDEISKLMSVPDEWTPPESRPYTPKENYHKWLTDEGCRDQFVIRSGPETEVFWNFVLESEPELVYRKLHWTESFVQWSPMGTYLATVHRQGVVIWGGATTFNRVMRFPHPQVKFIDFSPCERFLVTCSCIQDCSSRNSDHRMFLIRIFDVRTGKVMKDFKTNGDEFAIRGVGGFSWPVLKWGGGSHGNKYFALTEKSNSISVYETDTFTLIYSFENVMDFSWSPNDPILALLSVLELGGGGSDQTARRVSLMQIPKKIELRQKNLSGAFSDCNMYWQSNGDYLAVKVDRYTKTKKRTHTSFEVFRTKERDVPIEVVELEHKNDNVLAFSWEPKGHRFAVISHGDDSSLPYVSFYSMSKERIVNLNSLKGKEANALYWSPGGRFIVLAGLKGFNGKFEFYDVDDMETMATVAHYKANNAEWDPSGRYLATKEMGDGGFNLWSFTGKLLYGNVKDDLFQFAWRPRPPCLLSPEKEEEIVKNLKIYSDKFEKKDKEHSKMLCKRDCEKRKMMKEEWDRQMGEWRRLHEEEKLERHRLLDGLGCSDEEEEHEAGDVEVEELIDVFEEVICFD